MSLKHSIRAAAALVAAVALSGPATVGAQAARAPDARARGAAAFRIFVQAAQVGTLETRVVRDGAGWRVTSAGRLGAPLNLVTRQLVARYDANWRPLELTVDATASGQLFTIHTTVEGANATTDTFANGRATNATGPIDDTAIFLPNPFFGAFEALAARVHNSSEGAIIPIYGAPDGVYTAKVGGSEPEAIQTAAATVHARRTNLQFLVPDMTPLDVAIWTDPSGRLLRLSVPEQTLEVVREDIGSVAARRVIMARANDERVRIPSIGFSLAGTISKPLDAATEPLPAIVLVGGADPTDREELIAGIPIFAELSAALADRGFLVLRYDKRGTGQSGGRAEAATLEDYAEDLRAAVKFLDDRQDVADRRISIVAHSEGGMVAMITADKENKARALVLIGTPGVTGADLNLAQIRHGHRAAGSSAEELEATLELQRRIQDAVLTGEGWDGIEPQLRARADSPWFQSFLAFDPVRQMSRIDQPVMIVQGELDTEVEPSNADRLAELAAARKKAPPPNLLKVPGVNHLLVPARTGEVSEYASLANAPISPAIPDAIAAWLMTTLPPRR